MKAYCNIIDSKVMLSKLPKPDTESYSHILLNKEGVPTNILNIKEYQQALKEFNDSIIGEAENAERCYSDEVAFCVSLTGGYKGLKPNQPCEVEKSGDKYIIKSI